MNHHIVSRAGSAWVVSRVEAQPFGGIVTTTLSSHATEAQARVALAKATGQRPPRTISGGDFETATAGHTSRQDVWAAARFIAVQGGRWAQTCREFGVSLAAVSALLKRHGLR